MWTRYISLSELITCGRGIFLYLDLLYGDEVYFSILVYYMRTRIFLYLDLLCGDEIYTSISIHGMWMRFIPLSWLIVCGRDLYLYLDSLHVDEIYTSILIYYMWTRTILLSWFIKWVTYLFIFIICLCDFIKYFIIILLLFLVIHSLSLSH